MIQRRLNPLQKWLRPQSGVAAVEFALVLLLMLLLFSGLVIYWQVFQAQQSIARATGDGARMLQELIQGRDPAFNVLQMQGRALIEQQVGVTVRGSLLGAGLPESLQTSVQISWGHASALLQVSYPQVPILGALPVLGLNELKSSSIVVLNTGL